MNKYGSIIVLALATCVCAQELHGEDYQWGLQTTDEEEIKSLSEKTKPFAQFCLDSRDYVLGDIKDSADYGTSAIFKLFFGSAEALGGNGIEEQVTPGNFISDKEGLAAGLEDVREAAKSSNSLIAAFSAAFRLASQSIASVVSNKLEQIKQRVGSQDLVQDLGTFCNKVSKYDRHLREDFMAMRYRLSIDVKYADLHCVTSQRVLHGARVCEFVKRFAKPVISLFTRETEKNDASDHN